MSQRIRTIRPQIRPFRSGANRSYGNGRYSHRGRSRDWLKVGALALSIAVFLGIFGWLTWGAPFFIKTYTIAGASPNAQKIIEVALKEQAMKKRLGILPQSNLLLFDVSAAKDAIGDRLLLDRLDIERQLPGTILITAREKTTRAVWLSGGRFFNIDPVGEIIGETPTDELMRLRDLPPGYDSAPVPELGTEAVAAPESGPGAAPAVPEIAPANAMPLILDGLSNPSPESNAPGNVVVTPALLAMAVQVHERLAEAANDRVRWMIIKAESDSLEAVLTGDWRALLTATLPLDTQTARLSLILRDKVGSRKPELDYVDLRYNEKIFFRFKDAPPPATPAAGE